jgi:hypothetical protein
VGRKKSAFNIALISAVRKSEVYAKGPSDDKQIELWEKVAVEIGVTGLNFYLYRASFSAL